MITDAELRELTDGQRAELIRRLVALDMTRGAAWEERPTPLPPAAVHARHRFLLIITLACVALIPWIAVLAWTLPPDYVVANWAATWVGLDTVLLACLASTAWLAYRSRQMVIVMALVTGTLLLCDAWFDVLTASSRTDVILSVGSALLVEIPLAVLLFGSALRLIRLIVHRAWALAGHPGKVRLWQVPLLVPPRVTDLIRQPVEAP